MSTIAYQAFAPPLTTEERSKAAAYLTQTRDSLLEAIMGLTDAQWRFKPAADRWSITEILEHLMIVEGGVHEIVARMPEAPAAEADRNNGAVERIILTEVPRRFPRYQAPPHISPVQNSGPAELLTHFVERRAVTIKLLDAAPALRGHVTPHPVLGAWDGYQWVLATAAHTARHIEQILEVKAEAGFPEAQPPAPFRYTETPCAT